MEPGIQRTYDSISSNEENGEEKEREKETGKKEVKEKGEQEGEEMDANEKGWKKKELEETEAKE